ncbi:MULTISPECIES: acyl carrier protein [Streptomyces]|uniref:Acyl carrier protein n=1 Tax=Streptomyces lonegramiae TaxID=3075524 RepID=A0ABU2X8U0_9ACTN|nr:acyl carrier protein [Streptomyces sp. DSM 41529]MDT0541916.1 acyl carrier protein [Streptomyces sp. DSM 41529]
MTAEPTSRERIAAITTEFLATELEISPDGIGPADTLKALPGADSMKLLRVVSKLERRWDIEFDDQAVFSAETVDELVTLVHTYVGKELTTP